MAAPVVAQQLVLIGQGLVDIFWVGRISGDAVAAVGLVTPLLAFFGIGTQGMVIAGQILVSQRFGADDRTGARRAAGHAMVFILGINTLLAVVVFALADPLVRLVGASGAVVSLAVAYLSVLAFSRIPSGLSDVIEAVYQGSGDTRTPFALNLIAIAINLGLDPFLIFGWWEFPALGIEGAALATMIGYAVAATVGVITLLTSRTAFTIDRQAFVPDRETARGLVRIGAPRGGQRGVRQLARLVVVWIVATTGGGAALAAYTVGARVATVAFVPAIAIGRAAATMVGQNLGADRTDRASRATWLGVGFGVFVIGGLGVVQWLFPGTIARLFVPDIAGDALAFSVAYLQILAVGYWALGAIHTVEAGFNGAGRTEISLYSTALQYWTVRVPVAALLAFPIGLGLGAVGAFWAVTISNVVAAVGLVGYFRYSTAGGMLERAADTSGASSAD